MSAAAAATEEPSSLWVETAGTQDGRIGPQNEQEARTQTNPSPATCWTGIMGDTEAAILTSVE